MNFRAVLAMLVCKALRLVSRILHRGGTAMPGRIALKIYPELLSLLAKDVRTVRRHRHKRQDHQLPHDRAGLS